MICPTCNFDNLPGNDQCRRCQADLTQLDRPTAQDRFERSLMEETVATLSVALGQERVAFTALVPETASLEELFLGMTDGESSDHDRVTEIAV